MSAVSGIISGFRYFRAEPNKEEIEKLLLLVTTTGKEAERQGFIFARNYCISKWRSTRNEANKTAKRIHDLQVAEDKAKRFTAALEEFNTIAKQFDDYSKFLILRNRIFNGYSSSMLAKCFGIKASLVDQWKRRALKKMLPLASKDLKEYLLKRTWNKV